MRLSKPTLALALAGLATAASAQSELTTPDWYITVSDAGYSDFIVYTAGTFPPEWLHEFISGEWAAAVGYDGIQNRLTPPERTMWLEPTWDYPTWTSNSAFNVLTPAFPVDTDADGMPEGSAVIENGDVEITISWDPVDTVEGTPMGKGGGVSIRSNRYVLLVTYAIKNIKTTTLTGVRFYPFLHGHPANDERPAVRAAYDTTAYTGPLQEFRYDVTQWSTNTGATDGSATGCSYMDHIGFSTELAPADFGLGHFRGHIDRPTTGLHVDVEIDALGNQTTFGPDEVAGATRIDLGSIAPNATKPVRVLLSLRSDELSPQAVTATACVRFQDVGLDPQIRIDRGACGASSGSTPWDAVVGDLPTLLDIGGMIALAPVKCVASDATQDRVTVHTPLSDCRRAVFVLARRGAGQQLDYGASSAGFSRLSLESACP